MTMGEKAASPTAPVYWINQPPAATTLDIVCLGWSAPPSAVTQFDSSHAVAVIANPSHSRWVSTLTARANTYENCRITAWSLGVVTASRLLGNITHATWIAVNGVLHPFDGCLDRNTSEAMAAALTPAALASFQMGMCGTKSALHRWLALPGHPSLPEAQSALAWWIDLADQGVHVPADQWDRAVISTHDRIMRPHAQHQQWADHVASIDRPVAAHWIPDYLIELRPRVLP